MTNKSPPDVRNVPEPDPRIARTTHALGSAIIELLRERPLDDITVQQILDRAGVGRTAFYAHYRNKEDVLASSYERLFSFLDAWVERPSPVGYRLFPVREFTQHMSEANGVVEALRRDGRLDDVWSLCAAHAARLIDRRIADSPSPSMVPRQIVPVMLAGSLVELMRWWLDRPDSATPEQLDASFHHMAGRVLRAG